MTRIVLVLAVLGTASAVRAQERNTDRPGGDYRNFATAAGDDFRACQRACDGESRCRAWSFVRPVTSSQSGRCWLKELVPRAVPNDRVDSGVKGARDPDALTKLVARTGEVIETARTDLRPAPPRGAAVLESFSLFFQNGDHKMRRLGVLDDGRFARFTFTDQDSNDPFVGEGVWWSVPGGIEGEVHGTARSRAVVEIEAGPPNHTLVLRGFQVSRADGSDANVRTLGVSLDGDARTATVVLADDMGPDWRGFEVTLGLASVLAFIPIDTGTAVNATAIDALGRLNNGFAPQQGQVPGRPYAFTVQYAWIPDRLVLSERAMAGTERLDRRHVTERPTSPVALQGFTFSFGNSDHHLERVGIDLANAGSEPPSHLLPPPVYFKDHNYDDPMQWAVEYVTLRER